jgi:hypothetical protein
MGRETALGGWGLVPTFGRLGRPQMRAKREKPPKLSTLASANLPGDGYVELHSTGYNCGPNRLERVTLRGSHMATELNEAGVEQKIIYPLLTSPGLLAIPRGDWRAALASAATPPNVRDYHVLEFLRFKDRQSAVSVRAVEPSR